MNDEDWRVQEPLKEKIGCSSSKCDKDLHCFRKIRPRHGQTYRNRVCHQCGVNLIDWDRLDKKDLSDVEYTFSSLQKELIRHHFWHIDIDEKAVANARKIGLLKIETRTRNLLERCLRPPHDKIWRDGYQTPYSGNIIFYAQHSTSTCCRKCLEEWYGIDKNRSLTDEEMDYFIELIMRYICYRLPDLTKEGI